jgi:hypothetical protein
MKKVITLVLMLALSTGTFAHKTRKAHKHPGKHRVTTTTRQTKLNVNRAGHLNNGDNGDRNSNRGKGDANNRRGR